jgi:hypothetical protein
MPALQHTHRDGQHVEPATLLKAEGLIFGKKSWETDSRPCFLIEMRFDVTKYKVASYDRNKTANLDSSILQGFPLLQKQVREVDHTLDCFLDSATKK